MSGSAGERQLYYLGPEGTFTHQAAISSHKLLAQATGERLQLVPAATAHEIVERVEAGQGLGVLAWQNNVEGPVVPNMDALIDAQSSAAFAQVSVDIVFDAFVRPDHGSLQEVSAHPHGLAQCRGFIRSQSLAELSASSNAAACRDLTAHQVGLGPRICGELYGLESYQEGVQDFQGAHTDFFLLAPRAQVAGLARSCSQVPQHQGAKMDFESTLVFIPLHTGPGVLADLLDQIRAAGLNMTSFMSRPIKGHDGTYSFIVCLDSAPWEADLRHLLTGFIQQGVWVKTLAVCPRLAAPNPPVDQWMLPGGGAGGRGGSPDEWLANQAQLESELLW
ncbi:chorismate mutase [Bombiscardovia nodaiensis]|uniref:Prephenate dehydratase n=1 Tax=Bombiscardovia nodaiensis TaxID=2932181 RepID=A0ABN6SCI7_9BIFI|nr:chorismate mutase [Bombiscardovia nodaiensis]